jgi:hypothetical protein
MVDAFQTRPRGGFGVQAGYHASTASNGQAASRAARSFLSGGEGISIHAGRDATIVAATIVSKKGQVKIDQERHRGPGRR